jgi:hypothetical protein
MKELKWRPNIILFPLELILGLEQMAYHCNPGLDRLIHPIIAECSSLPLGLL